MARPGRAAPSLRARARRHPQDPPRAPRPRDRRPLLPRLAAHDAAHAVRVPRRVAAPAPGRRARQRRRLLEPRLLALHAGPPRTVPAHRDDGGDEEAVSLDQETGRDRYFAAREAELAGLLDLLEPYRGGGRLLDVGCSIGLFLDLARGRGWDGVGIEFAPRALTYARDEYGLEVLDVPLEEAGFEPASFDAVGLLSVLEHTNDPRRMLADVARVLRPGGAVFVVVPNVESLACRVLHERARTFDGRNHLVYFSPATLRDCLDRSGFDVPYVATKVSSFGPIAEHFAYEEPYSDAELADEVPARILAALEPHLDELGLGYKLHALAVKR